MSLGVGAGVDFHNHLLTAVDDGAATIEESRAALRAMREQRVGTVVVTPHLNVSLLERPAELTRILGAHDAAFEQLRRTVEEDGLGLRLERGVELMLDSPRADLSDPRLRLGGSRFILVEFPGMAVPPHSTQALYELNLQGWRPIVAHPERYRNMDDAETVDEWRSVGCFIQVNAGSLLGRYGDRAQKLAFELLGRGWVDFICSDYHARGRLAISECRDRLLRSGGEMQARLLLEANALHVLENEEPDAVPPLDMALPFWRKILRRG